MELGTPVELVLDEQAGIRARVSSTRDAKGEVRVTLAIHDPRVSEDPEGEVYALVLWPDRAWELGAALTRASQER